MRKEDYKFTGILTKQILMSLVDFSVAMHQVFDKGKIYRKLMKDYWKWRENDRIKFAQTVYRLKRDKLISIYKEGKEKYIELTPNGLDKIKKNIISEIRFEKPKTWDKKWRIDF